MVLILRDGTPAQRAAAGELILALHAAKQELAADLEANLKQLKSVLEETKRIAKDLEAVLQETKDGQPSGMPEGHHSRPDGLSRGGDHDGEERWNPPQFARPGHLHTPEWEPPHELSRGDREANP